MKQLMIAVLVALLTNVAYAIDMEATTLDGRQVLLKDDQTWEFMDGDIVAEEGGAGEEISEEGEDGADTLELKVLRIWDLPHSCKLGLQLSNQSAVRVNSLVPRFTVVIKNDIDFETVSTSFYGLKPTLSQYREVRFSDIQCKDIKYVRVHGADRCSMGELEKFSPVKGECLRRIKVLDTADAYYQNLTRREPAGEVDKAQQAALPPVQIKLMK